MQAPNPIAFTIAGIDIRWYGILIGIAFLLAIYISYRRAPKFDIVQDDILDLTITIVAILYRCLIFALVDLLFTAE